jgi:hypothetical protein
MIKKFVSNLLKNLDRMVSRLKMIILFWSLIYENYSLVPKLWKIIICHWNVFWDSEHYSYEVKDVESKFDDIDLCNF